jgi:hypothetical protein
MRAVLGAGKRNSDEIEKPTKAEKSSKKRRKASDKE